MSLEENKRIALDWVRATLAGDLERAKSLFTEDARLLIVGDLPNCGWMDVKAFYAQAGDLPLASPITMEIGEQTAEGDRVWFEAQSNAELVSGTHYNNYYAFCLRIRDGKIYEYREYSDTHYAYRLMPALQGDPVTRVRTFDKAAATFTGSAFANSLQTS